MSRHGLLRCRLGAVGNLLVEGLFGRLAQRWTNGLATWRSPRRQRLRARWMCRGKSLIRRHDDALGRRCPGRRTARADRRHHGFRWRPRGDRRSRWHLLGRNTLVGWNDDALGWWRPVRGTARARRWHHGFGRWSRRRTLPLGRGPFLFLLFALVVLVGLGLREHACSAALDRLGMHKATGAGRKGEDTKESCQTGARHCWSRIGPGSDGVGARPRRGEQVPSLSRQFGAQRRLPAGKGSPAAPLFKLAVRRRSGRALRWRAPRREPSTSEGTPDL